MLDFYDPSLFSDEIRKLIHLNLQSNIGGTFSSHQDYPVFCCRHEYDLLTAENRENLVIKEFPQVLLAWAKLDQNKDYKPSDLLILDLETTGLGRGATIAFMVGLGYFDADKYIVEQLFLPEPDAEFNSFDRILELLEQKSVLVTFNGKTFDVPVLESRFLNNQLWTKIRNMEHIDVLHIARRLWKNRAPSCALETLEYYILGQIRDKELDIEGSIIPQTYYQFLITGEADLVQRIFIHNQLDVLNTATLLAMICNNVSFPLPDDLDYRLDYHAIAKLYQSVGQIDIAQEILQRLLSEAYLSPDILFDLGAIIKRKGLLSEAIEYFNAGAELNDKRCLYELAVYLEQKEKNMAAALECTERLICLCRGSISSALFSEASLIKRRDRLVKKLSKQD